ncbi:hypothetical protein BDN72DRAFT_833209 [Pluteus cervinus]|uniref:Uncharacterized protein n=1 Tax=Pluteus cervinus TaxID=181527 RepID=A0ACD3B952_9AGAR|nr:hypothetical protein BDN72DRAFT_833209 [Pluteus cervinus]
MSNDETPNEVRHDDIYYFENVIFQVENCLFKLPRHEFVSNSEFFRGLFSVPIPEAKQPDGQSDEQPLRLDGILEADFRVLVKLLYPMKGYKGVSISLETDEWKSILKLATLWEFTELRESAIDSLASIITDPVDKVVMSKEYQIDGWLLPALNALAQREKAISFEEAGKIGYETAFKLTALREIPQSKSPAYAQSSPHMIFCNTCTYHVSCPSRAPTSYNILPLGLSVTRGQYTMDYTNRIKAEFDL